jgi:hypothetical protein
LHGVGVGTVQRVSRALTLKTGLAANVDSPG